MGGRWSEDGIVRSESTRTELSSTNDHMNGRVSCWEASFSFLNWKFDDLHSAVSYLSPMNYLGHLYVSGDTPLVIVGNFMADAIKGRDLSQYHPDVERGIRMHRAIDSFTDKHPLQQEGRARVRHYAGRYSGVVMDMFYDHLLAKDPHWWVREPLSDFVQRMYTLLPQHVDLMTERTQHLLHYMVSRDWLNKYRTIEGIGAAISGLARRVPKGDSMIGVEHILEEHFDLFNEEFRSFLPELELHIAEYV